MNSKLISIITIMILAVFLVTACAQSAPFPTNDPVGEHEHDDEIALPEITPVSLADGQKLTVVASTSIIGDVIASVAGEAIELKILIERGLDPHSYQPTPQDMALVEQANIVFLNGLNLEEGLANDLETVATGVLVEVSAGIEPLTFEDDHPDDDHPDDDHHHEDGDPHVWLNPNNVIVWVENIEHVLAKADPQNHEIYEGNAEIYIDELTALDSYIQEQVTQIPESKRKLVTDHRIFSYFADQYGFKVIGAVIPGYSSAASASALGIIELAGLVKQEDVPAIFIGATANQGLQGLTNSIVEETGEPIKILPLLTESLAAENQPGDTYLDYMLFNIDQIVLGLGE